MEAPARAQAAALPMVHGGPLRTLWPCRVLAHQPQGNRNEIKKTSTKCVELPALPNYGARKGRHSVPHSFLTQSL